MLDGRLIETDARRQRPVDRVLAAVLADLVGMASQAIGEVDPEPVGPNAAERQRCPARVGTAVECCRRRLWQARHWLSGPDREQSGAPLLGGGL